MREGRMANAQLTNYIIPTTLDTPPVDVTILESPYRHGPFGAKGVGEMPMSGPAPAVANALRHLGLDVRSLPITPEKVLECASSLNGRRDRRRRAAAEAAARRPARGLRPHRDEGGLRRGRVRRVHGARRRRCRSTRASCPSPTCAGAR